MPACMKQGTWRRGQSPHGIFSISLINEDDLRQSCSLDWGRQHICFLGLSSQDCLFTAAMTGNIGGMLSLPTISLTSLKGVTDAVILNMDTGGKKTFFKGPQWIKEHNVIHLRMTAKLVFTLESILVHHPQVYLVKGGLLLNMGFSSWYHSLRNSELTQVVDPAPLWISPELSFMGSDPLESWMCDSGASHSNSLSIRFVLYQMDMTMPPFQNIVCLLWVHMCRAALDQDNLKHTIKPSHSLLSSLPALVEGALDSGEEDESCWLAPGNWQRFVDSGFRKSLAVRVVWLVKVDMESVSVGNRCQIKKVGR